MADTLVADGLRVQQWDDKFFVEWMLENPFSRYMGTSENDIIQIKEELTKKRGDSVTYALVNRLRNNATQGSNMLEGNEEELTSRSQRVYVDKRRHAVRIPEMEEIKSAIDLRDAAREALKSWMMELQRDRFIAALGSINGTLYASASEADKDAWLADNADRVLFGALKSNNSGNDHSASLANVDNTSDKLTCAALRLMKRMALKANPKIRPTRTENGKWFFEVWAGSNAFRDLKNDPELQQAQREVQLKNQNLKIFEGGDIDIDGMIVHEVPDIQVISGVGNGNIDVEPVYLCGAQALGYALAKRTYTKTKEFDYDDKFGTAVGIIDGIEKLSFGTGSGDTDDLKQHGMVTGYFAGVADS